MNAKHLLGDAAKDGDLSPESPKSLTVDADVSARIQAGNAEAVRDGPRRAGRRRAHRRRAPSLTRFWVGPAFGLGFGAAVPGTSGPRVGRVHGRSRMARAGLSRVDVFSTGLAKARAYPDRSLS